jgi:quinol monooxygenase YgiN
MIIVTGTILAKPDTFDTVLKLSREHVERSRREDGCISHDVHVDTENRLRLFFYEQWRDEAALRAHFAVPESRGFVKALRDLIVETTGTQIWNAEKIER